MRHANFSTHLYGNALSAFDTALSPMNVAHGWSNVRQQLKPEHMVALQFCGEILPDEEDEIPLDDLVEIAALIGELQELLAKSDALPLRLRRIIENQIEHIHSALSEYTYAGAKALRDAVRSSYGELVEAKDIIAEHKNSPEVSKLAEVWRKVNTAADAALKVDGVAQLGQKAWLFIEAVIKGVA